MKFIYNSNDLCHHEIYFMSFYFRNSLTFVTKNLILCHILIYYVFQNY